MRSGYSDNIEQRDLAMWRGRVASATRGKRGQKLLRDLIDALDAMPNKQLISEWIIQDDEVCALGSVGLFRGIEGMDKIDPEDHDRLAGIFDVSPCLIQEIEFCNDEDSPFETPKNRWKRMREWAYENLIPSADRGRLMRVDDR